MILGQRRYARTKLQRNTLSRIQISDGAAYRALQKVQRKGSGVVRRARPVQPV